MFGTIKRIIWFLQFELIFEISARRIFISWMYKKIRAIFGLFFSNVFQSFIFDRHFIPSKLYLFINRLKFETLDGCGFSDLSLLFFVFYPVRRLYRWFTTFKIVFVTFVIEQLDWIFLKNNPLIAISKSIWYLERSDSKSLSTTSFALS